jgi:electron-transferring-flavoprotein dehydrogenase
MSYENAQTGTGPVSRQHLDVDIVCVGFGPATAAFLSRLSQKLLKADGTFAFESTVSPGMPLQVLCYERADGPGFGVSGLVTRGQALRETFPEIDGAGIPMAAPVGEEKVVYLLDPVGASRRSGVLRAADACIRAFRGLLPYAFDALDMPWAPGFLHKRGGLVLSIGQFMQWVAARLQGAGTVQIWPGMPVSRLLIEGNRVLGVRLLDQGVDRMGKPAADFMPGMDVHAALTVVGDGAVGAVGQQLDAHFGVPGDRPRRDWAVGMKFVVDLPENTALTAGTVLHTFGYPEPEIFGFLYVHPRGVASLGIFVPSWFDSPVRTAYRYLQHWMLHPYLWRYIEGGKLRSWGAKTVGESGRRGEPYLVGDGYARIGEGTGSTNVLTGSGVDEAWATGVQLAEAVLELLEARKPFTKENLEATYVQRRRASWVEREARVAERSRDGFQRGVVPGLLGMVLAALSRGRLVLSGQQPRSREHIRSLEDHYHGRIPPGEVRKIRQDCYARGVSAHAALMERAGWPAIPYDGQLLVSHQDALLLGGKVQAPPGYADHVAFVCPDLCRQCATKLCVEMCSGQAITPGDDGVPHFDREKCIHCGACLWNCPQPLPGNPAKVNLVFQAGAGGLHSVEN